MKVLGSEMAYLEVGQGDPIVLLHGNPTSSYLWRNVVPHLQPQGRCIAPDLIGMGDSEKLPASGPGAYRFVEQRRYLDALLQALDVDQQVTFVIHDWGSALGFDWANRHRQAVKGIAYMEAIMRPQSWDHWDNINLRPVLEALRSQAGETMVLQDNAEFRARRVVDRLSRSARVHLGSAQPKGPRSRCMPLCANAVTESDSTTCSPDPGTLTASAQVIEARLVLDQPVDGVWASDHFGLLVDLDITGPD